MPLPDAFQARDRRFQPFVLHGLEHVVHGGPLERLQRELVVRGHEYHQRRRIEFDEFARNVHAAHAGHADVQEHYGRLMLARGFQRGDTVVHDADYPGFWPQRRQFGFQYAGQQRFVIGNQQGRGHGRDQGA
ncbi:hypothetical protein AWV80_23505 [Cupriavidus sp. UYMU48A]|nr:hypothetical protein AWV80_23505 [Cupriavidus sp. UYMU48A]